MIPTIWILLVGAILTIATTGYMGTVAGKQAAQLQALHNHEKDKIMQRDEIRAVGRDLQDYLDVKLTNLSKVMANMSKPSPPVKVVPNITLISELNPPRSGLRKSTNLQNIKKFYPRRNKRAQSSTHRKDSTQLQYKSLDQASYSLKDTSGDKQQAEPKLHMKVLESGIIAPEIGLVMEQSGTYMEFSSYIYVPIIYHMPHIVPISQLPGNATCPLFTKIPSPDLILDLLKNKIGTMIPGQPQSRKKRFIEMAIVGGVAAWNRASIWSLQSSVSALDEQVKEIRDHSLVVTQSINTMIQNQQTIHHAVDKQAQLLFSKRKHVKTAPRQLVTAPRNRCN